VLAFPGVFRGLLDAGASDITVETEAAAALAIAHVLAEDELNPSFIVPSVFNPEVVKSVAEAVRQTEPARTFERDAAGGGKATVT